MPINPVLKMPEAITLPDEEQCRVRAANLGMMIFIASETMLFAGMFALYAAYRYDYPAAFAHGVRSDLRWLGSLNTYILIFSSWTVVMANACLKHGRERAGRGFVFLTLGLGAAFLALKIYEYVDHIHHTLLPGAGDPAFPGSGLFFALYYLMTGTHGLHILAGGILLWWAWGQRKRPHVLDLASLYWHFVDIMWVFLWPLFYLLR